VATQYVEQFEDVAHFEASAKPTSTKTPIGFVDGELLVQDNDGNSIPVGRANIVSVTAAATLDPETHGNRTAVVNVAAGAALVLPAATGGGDKYRVVIGTANSGGAVTVTTASGDILKGTAIINNTGDSTAATADAYAAGASDEVFTFATASGVGDFAEFEDIADGVWAVFAVLQSQADPATPFTSA